MIGISTVVFDLKGHVLLDDHQDNKIDDITRRMSRAKNLTGGANISDRGFSHADRTFEINILADQTAKIETLRSITQKYSLVNVSTREGMFAAWVKGFIEVSGGYRLTLLVKEKLT